MSKFPSHDQLPENEPQNPDDGLSAAANDATETAGAFLGLDALARFGERWLNAKNQSPLPDEAFRDVVGRLTTELYLLGTNKESYAREVSKGRGGEMIALQRPYVVTREKDEETMVIEVLAITAQDVLARYVHAEKQLEGTLLDLQHGKVTETLYDTLTELHLAAYTDARICRYQAKHAADEEQRLECQREAADCFITAQELASLTGAVAVYLPPELGDVNSRMPKPSIARYAPAGAAYWRP